VPSLRGARPKYACASRCAESIAASTSFGLATTFIPRPPPPYAAFTATGHPCDSPNARTSSGEVIGSLMPGTPATSARVAASRAEILSPIDSIASGGGPMNATPSAVIARAKSAFSEKNP
jgi:hypothetical protein